MGRSGTVTWDINSDCNNAGAAPLICWLRHSFCSLTDESCDLKISGMSLRSANSYAPTGYWRDRYSVNGWQFFGVRMDSPWHCAIAVCIATVDYHQEKFVTVRCSVLTTGGSMIRRIGRLPPNQSDTLGHLGVELEEGQTETQEPVERFYRKWNRDASKITHVRNYYSPYSYTLIV